MERVWYLEFNSRREGPYSVKELKRDLRITPDTLVWREGFPRAVPIRYVPELKEIFADEKPQQTDDQNSRHTRKVKTPGDEICIDLRSDPPYLYILLMVVLFFVFYLFYKLYELG